MAFGLFCSMLDVRVFVSISLLLCAFGCEGFVQEFESLQMSFLVV
jgi:hypothetical protein